MFISVCNIPLNLNISIVTSIKDVTHGGRGGGKNVTVCDVGEGGGRSPNRLKKYSLKKDCSFCSVKGRVKGKR